ncbi:MAG: hypothetical protein NC307_11825 [Roseburia sp.]|nr:hypothetical protein [Roseburia sp.]
MKTVIYEGIPNYAKEARQKVFIDEQGFHNEVDDDEIIITNKTADLCFFQKQGKIGKAK